MEDKIKDYEGLRNRLWEIQSLSMVRPTWQILYFGIILIALGFLYIFPINLILSTLSTIVIILGSFSVWGFIYIRITDNAVVEKLGWVDHSLEMRNLFLKGKYGMRKRYNKQQLEILDEVYKRKTRPSDQEFEEIAVKVAALATNSSTL